MDGFFFKLSFVVLSLITVLSALMVATMRNLSRAIMFLVFFFLGAAGLYFLLEAEFLALVQVMVYAGAVSVLFAFVIMLTPQLPGVEVPQTTNHWAGLIITVVFLLVMLFAFREVNTIKAVEVSRSLSLNDLGQTLLGQYLLPFELVSLLLLVALVGAVMYTSRGHERGEKEHGSG
ncbi:NADH-quinone oxidoreductase subunit J family protein [Calderihabitans maritimus]|uniref:NADH-quinone oxidoreductase subunit J n=1 Tax=Calderihabitans maritimus TaxID=1246530 RepID=A0A1Z5HXT0_9FIRM|nr:NADH-quinone oxidoreductase subunit J [Calderihabitans maritimus]GAW94177.1 NADH:ubiquinone oxidoreductase subunit J [Calderihabitans maritimus]